MSGEVDPLSVPCLFCGAEKGYRCGTVQGGVTFNAATKPHKFRLSDAEKLATKGLVRGPHGWTVQK